jgi:hypothetical protein
MIETKKLAMLPANAKLGFEAPESFTEELDMDLLTVNRHLLFHYLSFIATSSGRPHSAMLIEWQARSRDPPILTFPFNESWKRPWGFQLPQ